MHFNCHYLISLLLMLLCGSLVSAYPQGGPCGPPPSGTPPSGPPPSGRPPGGPGGRCGPPPSTTASSG
ncbi:small nuclear ribonucleoprotein-associated protein B [Drosophila miranda]|uniref:small nuclear ribonucleoprotein-associated protein B n=1 Tax=Drosophila miranda TaxID=7229 RepID=UPI0007E8327D|nr:small nuclear ribonucleoprotein-associated protein B [Drosophila miranda]